MSERLRVSFGIGLVAVAAALGAVPATAQPFVAWMVVSGPTNGYIEVPHSPALNPTSGFTLEAWVNVTDPGGCSSIAGKGYQSAWWVGICGTTLRSYLRGSSGPAGTEFGLRDAGKIPPGQWTHVAVVFDGSHRIHYINGEQVGFFAETSGLTTNSSAVRIASDVNYNNHTPVGGIDEVRLWNVGRSQDQIRGSINVPLSSGTGLVASWHLDNSTIDSAGGHTGTVIGSVDPGFFTTVANCGSSTVSQLCLHSRFRVRSTFRTGAPGTAEGNASVVVAGADSGILWFFSANTWEVMVKALDGCGLNSRFWLFSAATTNVQYRLEVLDVVGARQKIYFNYPGPPAPAVTDVAAFATCP
ncbi:MAG: LamG domain-containing protein [Acidobacteriota bacterium]